MRLILKIIRNLFGYVSFKVVGGCPEKFLNLSIKDNFHIWNARKINGDLLASSPLKDYKKLRRYVRKSNSKMKIVKKSGVPFFIYKYRNRKGIIAGCGLFFAVLCIMPLYVWRVDVQGCNALSTEEVLKIMKDLGVSPGSFKYGINTAIVKQQAMQKIGSVAWMSINMNGSCAEVVIKEKTSKPEPPVCEDEPLNIVADFDGQIERMETYRGTPMVNSGDVVVKGQLLISGIVEKMSGGNDLVAADGKIYAKTHRILSSKLPMNFERSSDSGECVNKYRIKIFNFEIPISFKKLCDKNYRFETSNKKFRVFGFDLPIVLYKESAFEQKTENINLSEEEAKNEVMKLIEAKELEEFGEGDTQIKSRNWGQGKVISESGEYYLECQYDLLENISKKEKIILDK